MPADRQWAVRSAGEREPPLAIRLEAITRQIRRSDPKLADCVATHVRRLEKARAGSRAPRTGQQMPPFRLIDGDGRLVALAELLKEAPIIVTFLRGPWCPYCRLLVAGLAEIEAAPVKLVAITPDASACAESLEWETGTDSLILTDIDCGYALTLDLTTLADRRVLPAGSCADRNEEGAIGARTLLPIPAIFVVDQAGVIRFRHVNPDHRRRAEPAALAAVALRLCREAKISPN